MIWSFVDIYGIKTFFLRIPIPQSAEFIAHVIYCAAAVEGDLVADAHRELGISFPQAEPIDAAHFRLATQKEKGKLISTEYCELVMVVMQH